MIILTSIFISFFFVIFHKKFSSYVSVYDLQDNYRKFHLKKVALTGGIF